jgi:hypothetical protein
MFKIQDGRNQFYQWDIDRKLIINDTSVNEVHFCNRTDDCSLVCEVFEEDGKRVVNVPNILLQNDWKIRVYAYDSKYTKHCAVFNVVARTKPADYIYTETEVLNYNTLLERINTVEEDIGQAVKDYLEENPIEVEAGATEEEAAQIEANKQAIKELQEKEVDLTGYATEKYVDDAIAAIPETDLTGYATEQYVNSAIGAIEIPEVDLTGYATTSYVDEAIATIEIPEGSGGGEWVTLVEQTNPTETPFVWEFTLEKPLKAFCVELSMKRGSATTSQKISFKADGTSPNGYAAGLAIVERSSSVHRIYCPDINGGYVLASAVGGSNTGNLDIVMSGATPNMITLIPPKNRTGKFTLTVPDTIESYVYINIRVKY